MNIATLPSVLLLCGVFLAASLSGCSTGSLPTQPEHKHPETAREYLQSAQTARFPNSIEYRLKASELLIKEGNIAIAQKVLREAQSLVPEKEPELRQTILDARLTLLKQDPRQANTFIKSGLATLKQFAPLMEPVNAERIALLLPSEGPHAEAAKTIRDGFLAAYYKSLKSKTSEPIVQVYDTGQGNKIKEAYQKAIAEKADVIVGPLTKSEVQTLSEEALHVPVLALNRIPEGKMLGQLYQFGLIPEDEVSAVVFSAEQKGFKRALVLVPDSEWGQRISTTFKQQWAAKGKIIVETATYVPNQDLTDIVQTLLKGKGKKGRQDADMLFMAATPEAARHIKPLVNTYHSENFPVFATSAVYSGLPSPGRDQDLNGIQFCDIPWVLNASLQEEHPNTSRLPRFFALGMDSYDLAVQLSQQPAAMNSFSGKTGQLNINSQHHVQRSLSCAKFAQGVPVPD